MPSLKRCRQNTMCCLSLNVGCKLLAILELFFPPVYIYGSGIRFGGVPEILLVLFAVHYFAAVTLFCGTTRCCCMNPCKLIVSFLIRSVLLLSIACWSLYMIAENNAVLANLLTLFFGTGFEMYAWLCTWSYYLELTETPEPNRVLNLQISLA